MCYVPLIKGHLWRHDRFFLSLIKKKLTFYIRDVEIENEEGFSKDTQQDLIRSNERFTVAR